MQNTYNSYNGNRRKKRRRRGRRGRLTPFGKMVVIVFSLIVLGIIGTVLYFTVIKPMNAKETLPEVITTEEGETISTEAPSEGTTVEPSNEGSADVSPEYQDIMADAKRLAAMYDYDGAAELIQTSVSDYENIPELANFVSTCMAEKTQLVKWADNSQITHIFFHILVEDEQTAFALSNPSRIDYATVMTTADEFKNILQAMYERGYVLVHLSDIAKLETVSDGTQKMTYQPIYLPEGKIPFVLSQDDLCYYEYMLGSGEAVSADERGTSLTGYATKLVLDENGQVTNEMQMADGTYSYGSFDVVTILDDFVEEHPDFSYHGAKGTIALTGYNGIFGYRTSYITYGDEEVFKNHYNELFVGENFDEATAYSLAIGAHEKEMDPSQKDSLNLELTESELQENRAQAQVIAEALKADGWKFASHTWGHMNMTNFDPLTPAERFYRDSQWWTVEVESLIGETDTIIFAYGGDIGNAGLYTANNLMYRSLKAQGFDYFCNVDASKHYWVQMSSSVVSEDGSYVDDGFFRQARRNLDGQRLLEDILYPEKERLSDLFISKDIMSLNRPLPAAGDETFLGITLPEGFDPAVLYQ